MNPQYPDQNPYDFILNPQAPLKPKPFSGKNGFFLKIGLIVGGATVLMIVVAIVMNSLGGNGNAVDLSTLPLTQQKLIKISDEATHTATGQNLKNSAVTTEFTLRTQQQKLITYLAKQDIKISDKQLAAAEDATIKAQLKQAKDSSNFDVVYSQIIERELGKYLTELKNVYGTVTGPNARKLLNDDYSQTNMLLKQLNGGSTTDAAPATTTTPPQ